MSLDSSTLVDPSVPFGRFRLKSPLDLGVTERFIADDLERGHWVVLKRVAPDRIKVAGVRERFLEELSRRNRVKHPGLVEVLDHGEIDGVPYFATEHVDGRRLGRVIQDAGSELLPLSVVMEIALRVIVTLTYAHERGLIHGDLRPRRVLVSRLAEVKLEELGSGRYETRAWSEEQRMYVAPEVLAGNTPSAASDLYAFGLLVVELLTGQPLLPMGPEGVHDLRGVLRERVTAFHPEVPSDLLGVVTELTQIDPSRRTPDARTALSTVRRTLDQVRPGVRLSYFLMSGLRAPSVGASETT